MPHLIRRIQEPVLSAFLKDPAPNKDVLLVEGARQTGKTTLVEQSLAAQRVPVLSVNLEKQVRLRGHIDACEEFSEFEEVLADHLGFDRTKRSILFLDESQESSKLGSFVRFMKETWEKTSVILSGSTLTRLFRPDTRFPVGRTRRLLVTPFCFTEFLSATGKKTLIEPARALEEGISPSRHHMLLESWDAFLESGGLPAVVMQFAAQGDHRTRRADILADYEEDFRRLFGEKDLPLVKGCLRSVAHFAGSPSKNTTVMPSAGTAVNQRINEIFARLEQWHLVLRFDQKGPAPEGSYDYHPKRYLFDTGLLKQMRESGFPSLSLLENRLPDTRGPLGGLLENQLAIEIARAGLEPAGWKKTPSGGEIDFILKWEDRAFPMECKAALKLKGSHFRGILDYLELYGMDTGFTVSGAPFEVIPAQGKKIVNIPFYACEAIPEALARYAGK
jgi:predicted AAA+ superfamily ATPase